MISNFVPLFVSIIAIFISIIALSMSNWGRIKERLIHDGIISRIYFNEDPSEKVKDEYAEKVKHNIRWAFRMVRFYMQIIVKGIVKYIENPNESKFDMKKMKRRMREKL